MMNNNRNRNHARKKSCQITKNKIEYIDYKDTELLRKFMSTNHKILPARATGTKPKFQRQIAKAIKRSQIMGLLEYSNQ